MNNFVVIAVDGPSCSGKSTIARNLARSLGFVHLNSGALYRGVALLASRSGLALDGALDGQSNSVGQAEIAQALSNLARSTSFEFRTDKSMGAEVLSEQSLGEQGLGERGKCAEGKSCGGASTRLLINGVDEESNLYTPEVSQGASRIAIYSQVRDVLTEVQRDAAKSAPLVLEGRDAGTVVFPQTPYKYYLDAALEVRARRRLQQLEASGVGDCLRESRVYSLGEVTEEMRQRDERDMKRDVTPLRQAADAKVIDTTMLTEEEVVERIKKDVLSPSS